MDSWWMRMRHLLEASWILSDKTCLGWWCCNGRRRVWSSPYGGGHHRGGNTGGGLVGEFLQTNGISLQDQLKITSQLLINLWSSVPRLIRIKTKFNRIVYIINIIECILFPSSHVFSVLLLEILFLLDFDENHLSMRELNIFSISGRSLVAKDEN